MSRPLRVSGHSDSAAFIAPSFALVIGVAVCYVRFQGLSVVQSLFYGIAPAVMAIIALAAVKLGRLTNGRDLTHLLNGPGWYIVDQNSVVSVAPSAFLEADNYQLDTLGGVATFGAVKGDLVNERAVWIELGQVGACQLAKFSAGSDRRDVVASTSPQG